jgi:hypothetical protein
MTPIGRRLIGSYIWLFYPERSPADFGHLHSNKVCFILMPFILVSLLISRAVDMHQETHQPMLQALYDANANLGGLIIIFGLGTFLLFGMMFIRRQWPGQKLS